MTTTSEVSTVRRPTTESPAKEPLEEEELIASESEVTADSLAALASPAKVAVTVSEAPATQREIEVSLTLAMPASVVL